MLKHMVEIRCVPLSIIRNGALPDEYAVIGVTSGGTHHTICTTHRMWADTIKTALELVRVVIKVAS